MSRPWESPDDWADTTAWPGLRRPSEWRERTPAGGDWPRVSIVTPVLNGRPFIEATILSVLKQGYPNLEYIIIDGGSTDGTIEVIRSYEKQLAFWTTEPDRGMYEAINKGFARASGEVFAWLNGDDMYLPWTLWIIGEIFSQLRGRVHWLLGAASYWDIHHRLLATIAPLSYHRKMIALGAYQSHGLGCIQQESSFWTRTLWDRAGGYLDGRLRLAADFDLWKRFAGSAPLHRVEAVLSGFRVHPLQQSRASEDLYQAEVDRILHREPGGWIRRLLRPRHVRWLFSQIIPRVRGGGPVIRYDRIRLNWTIIEQRRKNVPPAGMRTSR